MNKPKRAEGHTSKVLGDLLREITPEEQARTENKMLLAVKIEDARKASGWTRKDFASAMNQHPSVISKWLSGTHNFTADTLWDIEEKLGIELLALSEREWKITKVVEYRIVVHGSTVRTGGVVQAYPEYPAPEQTLLEPRPNNMANEANNIVPVFQLRAVELHELTITKPTSVAASPTKFNFEIGIETNVDNNQKLIINATKVKIRNEAQDTVLGSIVCACVFSVTNFEEMIMMNGTRAEINETFAETLNSISISTTRGMMFSELKGTFLHYAFLPVVDVKKLAKATV